MLFLRNTICNDVKVHIFSIRGIKSDNCKFCIIEATAYLTKLATSRNFRVSISLMKKKDAVPSNDK